MATDAPETITIEQGATWSGTWSYQEPDGTPIDLSTGYTAKMQIREDVADSGAAVLLELTDAAGISLDDGSYTLSISASATEGLDFSGDRAVFDVEITETETGDVTRVLEGAAILDREVTR